MPLPLYFILLCLRLIVKQGLTVYINHTQLLVSDGIHSPQGYEKRDQYSPVTDECHSQEFSGTIFMVFGMARSAIKPVTSTTKRPPPPFQMEKFPHASAERVRNDYDTEECCWHKWPPLHNQGAVKKTEAQIVIKIHVHMYYSSETWKSGNVVFLKMFRYAPWVADV